MKKRIASLNGRWKYIFLTIAAVLFIFIIIIPLSLLAVDGPKTGNVALIPIEGVIVGSGRSSAFGPAVISSQDIVEFIQQADKNPVVEVILLEINSPGGSAVASDEIATAIKQASKPVVSLIREVGASGGYWIASASDFIMANRMSITGSIGVISSYLEFSGLMEDYGIGYERLVAGQRKDLGVPFRKLNLEEKTILQKRLDKIQEFFISEVSKNRGLDEHKVQKLATGEFFLGIEAKQLGLIDELGGKSDLEVYLKEKYQLRRISYSHYQLQPGLFGSLANVMNNFGFTIGEGLGTILSSPKPQAVLI